MDEIDAVVLIDCEVWNDVACEYYYILCIVMDV